MKILVVDDSRAMRMIVKRTLRQAGFKDAEITEAGNGLEALKAIQTAPPDLVMCDWNMPEMSGMELLIELKRIESPVKFGFVTSEGSPEMKQQAHEAGALFLIAKPFDAQKFRDALAEVA